MSELKIINFGQGLLNPTLEGIKNITLRNYQASRHDLKKGEFFIGRFAEGLDVVLRATQKTVVTTFEQLSDEVAREGGYSDATIAIDEMKQQFSLTLPLTLLVESLDMKSPD